MASSDVCAELVELVNVLRRDLIHWESQSATSLASPTGSWYFNHAARASEVVLFARLGAGDRSLWCLGPATWATVESSST